MRTAHGAKIRQATPEDDLVTTEHFYSMWLGMSYPADKLRPEFQQQTLRFIADARQQKQYKCFIAEMHGTPVGTVCCQLYMGLYPLVFEESDR